jgi:hypothetical protein
MGMASKTKVTLINVQCIYQLYTVLYTPSCTGNAPIRLFA